MSPPFAGKPGGRERFETLWRRNLLDGASDDATAIYQRLEQAYREPQRFYHCMAHIEHCLAMFDQCHGLMRCPDAVELAIWFHDAIYVPGNADNEARSAVLYQELAQSAHPDELCRRVPRMIIATLHNGKALDDDDTRYLIDIDLSSFGLPWDAFLRDSQDLRRENPQTTAAEYYRCQIGFQRNLLARDSFFLTDFFRERYEDQARDNLARYFELIEQEN